MKQLMNYSLRGLFALAFVSACAFGVARADVRDGRVISARAGGVNFVSGDVKVRRAGAGEWRGLSAEDELKRGDAVRTGAAGQVEILLNPGSYFRAGASTEFTLAETDLDDLRVELARGSVVVEATGYGDLDLSITLVTPLGRVRLVRSGVYRVNVPHGGATELGVTKGRALLGETVVKGGKFARAAEGGVEVSKLDKESRDALDLWSRERGKELARANERLTRRAMTTAFARSGFDSLFIESSRASGFWFWNDRSRCYTFLPFYANWRSPYGYGYDTGVRPYGGSGETLTPGYPSTGGGANSNPSGGTTSGGPWPGGAGGSGSGGAGRTAPTPVTPPSRGEPGDRPMRERTIEPGSRP